MSAQKKYLSDRMTLLGLMILAVAIMGNPFYLKQELNLFEWGLYLPGIDAVSQGQVPFRDFFHLRGPFELYAPAFFMKIFGFRADVLAAYFYLGSMLTILVAVLIAYELIGQRVLLYSFVLILATRTFPRVVFTYWGGMRYAWGLLAVWCIIRFFKTKRPGWLAAAGCLAAMAAWTSIEIGVSVLAALLTVMFLSRECRRRVWFFFAGFLMVSVPFGIYLLSQNAFKPFLQTQWIVVTHMEKVFLQTDPVPDTFSKLWHALFVPWDKNFHQMTPLYCYGGFLGLYVWRLYHQKITALEQSVLALAIYGLMLFFTGFRHLWASQFEMSLQPEKIVLFFLLEQCIVGVQLIEPVRGGAGQRRARFKWIGAVGARHAVPLLLAAVVLSSVVYSVSHFSKKFYRFSWGHKPAAGALVTSIDLPRIKHMTIPAWQAKDLVQLKAFVDEHVPAHEPVWMYPELGSLHFVLQRPWVGRFPMATMSWLDEGWFADYAAALERNPPKFAIVNKKMPFYFDKVYFLVPANRIKHERMMQFLYDHYVIEGQTPTYFVYRRKL